MRTLAVIIGLCIGAWWSPLPAHAPTEVPPALYPHHPATRPMCLRYHIKPELADIILFAADRHKLPHMAAIRLVRRESWFKSDAIGLAGEVGLTQLMLTTARRVVPDVTPEELLVPKVNVEIGFKYLARLRHRYHGNLRKALVAYNQGVVSVDHGVTTSPYAADILRR